MTRITALSRSLSDRWLKTTRSALAESNFGIKVLFEPLEVDVDVVFVHGITGHREETWSAPDGTGPWPRNLLPALLPRARILTFGYDAAVVGAWWDVSGNRLGDHARNLLSALAGQRAPTSSVARPALPLIFVAHSLGGLLVKDTLLASRASPEAHLRAVHDCTQGILFLGTPHLGSNLATVAERCVRAASLVGVRTNNKIVQVLRRDSEVLDRIQHDFQGLLRTRPLLGIVCFYEELAISGVGVVVPRESAVLPGYTGIGIHSHHRDIARFASVGDPGFLSVLGELRRLVADNTSLHQSEHGSTSDKTVSPWISSEGEDKHNQSAPSQGLAGITIWGNVYNSSVVNGPHTIAGDLVFGR